MTTRPMRTPPASSPAARATMLANRGRHTRPELSVRRALFARGLRYRLHRRPLAGLRAEADIVFAREKVAVFVDGCFWHRCPEHGVLPKSNRTFWLTKLETNVARDRRSDLELFTNGWTVVRVWEHEPVHEAADRIEAAVRARRRDGARRASSGHR